MNDDDEPRPNSPEDLGWNRQSCAPPVRLPPAGKFTTRKEEAMATSKTTKDDDKPEEEGPRGFSVLLTQIDDGDLHAELSKAVQSLVRDLTEYANKYRCDAKGKLALALSFTVMKNGTVSVTPDVKSTIPKAKWAGSVFFRTPGNNLSVENQRQQSLPLHALPATKQPARDITDSSPPVRSL